MTHISIDHLELRFKGVTPPFARAAAAGLGTSVLQELAERARPATGSPHVAVGDVAAGEVQMQGGATPARVSRAIAGSIGRAVEAKLT